jgi:hypothetical protein
MSQRPSVLLSRLRLRGPVFTGAAGLRPVRHLGALAVAAALAAAVACLSVALTAQTADAPSAQIPRTRDGHPDFSGIWQVFSTAAWNLQDHVADKNLPAGFGVVEGNEIPYQPWALAKKQANFANRATLDPETKCYLPGVPRITYQPYPFQIAQTPKTIALLYEYVHAARTVFVDGTEHPPGHIDWWMGDSRGHWDGDTLVVDVVDFNEETWFDRAGNFHSDELHVIERYAFIDKDHLRYEATIEDPKVFTRPWKIQMPLYRRIEPRMQVLEYECYAFDNQFHGTPQDTRRTP